ncbi:hypothetical protein V6N13_040935 [Hibiscus sabdariffa]
MECFGPVFDIGTRMWDCCFSRHVGYVSSLEENLHKLRTELQVLNTRSHEVRQRVEAAEQEPRLKRTVDVEKWLTLASAMVEDAK